MTGRELECRGRVRLGAVAPEVAGRLAGFAGEWLEYSPDDQAILVRHVQPGGTPANSAVPAELIALLDRLDDATRGGMPGGTLVVRDRDGVVLRLVVARGEIRVQWPREDWEHAAPVELETVFRSVEPVSARVSGTVRFSAPEGSERGLAELVEQFEGLYPEGELRLSRRGEVVRAELDGVNVGPEELLARLRELARPESSLEGELEIGSFAANAIERDFRLALRGGVAEALRPALWPEG